MCFAGKKHWTTELSFPRDNICSQADVCTGLAYPNGAMTVTSVHYAVMILLYRHYVQYHTTARLGSWQKAINRYRGQESAHGESEGAILIYKLGKL